MGDSRDTEQGKPSPTGWGYRLRILLVLTTLVVLVSGVGASHRWVDLQRRYTNLFVVALPVLLVLFMHYMKLIRGAPLALTSLLLYSLSLVSYFGEVHFIESSVVFGYEFVLAQFFFWYTAFGELVSGGITGELYNPSRLVLVLVFSTLFILSNLAFLVSWSAFLRFTNGRRELRFVWWLALLGCSTALALLLWMALRGDQVYLGQGLWFAAELDLTLGVSRRVDWRRRWSDAPPRATQPQ